MGKEGLSAPANTEQTGGERNELGQWRKGVSGNPSGRPKRGPEHFSHFLRRLPPEEMAEYMEWGIQKAKEQNSPKAVLAFGELYYAYLDGKPVQTVVNEQGGLGDLADELGIDLSE